jgi:hypothetical protein
MKNYKAVAQLVLNITLISTTVAILFFTYGKDIEKLIVEDQSKSIATELSYDAKIFFPKKVRESIVSSISIPSDDSADDEVKSKNSILVKNGIIIFGTICVVGIVTTMCICFFGKVNITHIILESLIILAFTVATEVLFLNVVARSYKSTDANFVKLQVLKSVKNELQAKID